jgi:sialate O-acetylesterase
MELPSRWENQDLPNFDGVVWFRKTVQIPETWSKQECTLELGPIDDIDQTFVNGRLIGTTDQDGSWMFGRKYTIQPGTLKDGENLVAVRVLDTGGDGGLYGNPTDLKLYPSGNPSSAIPLSGAWKYKEVINLKTFPARPEPMSLNAGAPASLFNGMINPITPLTIRGAIWYQGESNQDRAIQYRSLFPDMITDWREHWNIGDFPFLFVQIAPFNYGENATSQMLREAQFMTLDLPNTGMVVTTDIGNLTDIHPKNKQEVGRRLALWALANSYGFANLVHSGPLYHSMRIEEGKIRLFFTHTGSGLLAKNGDLTDFEIAGTDRRFIPANARIDGDTVVASHPDVPEPIAVRFGWSNTAEPNFFNKEGLPASTFRTDLW